MEINKNRLEKGQGIFDFDILSYDASWIAIVTENEKVVSTPPIAIYNPMMSHSTQSLKS